MAQAHGHGNPHWTRDETLLALDLYFELNGVIPSSNDVRLKSLSELLRRLPYHAQHARRSSFRNPDGVAFKLQNLRYVATGIGLGNVSNTDREIWQTFGHNPDKTKVLAQIIKNTIENSQNFEAIKDEVEFVEGRIFTKIHSIRERDPSLRQRLIKSRISSKKFYCELCGMLPKSSQPLFHDTEFEAHHIIPLAISDPYARHLSEMALLCANCHRLIHRAIASEKRWLSISEAKALIKIRPRNNLLS